MICFLEGHKDWPHGTSHMIGISICPVSVSSNEDLTHWCFPHNDCALPVGRHTATWRQLEVGGPSFSGEKMAVLTSRGLGTNIKWYEYSSTHLNTIFFVKTDFQDLQDLHHKSKTNQWLLTIFVIKGFPLADASVSPVTNDPVSVV